MESYKIKDVEIPGLNTSVILLNLKDEETLNQYFDLFETCFGKRANIDKPLFQWLNIDYPHYGNLNFAFLDNDTNQLIAAYGLQPGDAFVEGSLIKYALCTNVMSHPSYGGKGLFRFIGREALQYAKVLGINFCFGLPNDKAMNGHLKVGWKKFNEMNFYQWDSTNEVQLKAVDHIIPDFSDKLTDAFLFSLFADKYKFYFSRTSSWMRWRMSKPQSKYYCFGVNNSAERGFVVIKKFNDPLTNKNKLHIVDFGYNDLNCFLTLIKHCCWIAQQEQFDLLNMWHYSFNSSETELLLSLGFKLTEQKNPVIIHNLDKNMEIPADKWHITLFDNDVY